MQVYYLKKILELHYSKTEGSTELVFPKIFWVYRVYVYLNGYVYAYLQDKKFQDTQIVTSISIEPVIFFPCIYVNI